MSRNLHWYSRKRNIEIRLNSTTSIARYVLHPEQNTGDGDLFHQPYVKALEGLCLPAFILPLVDQTGHCLRLEHITALDTYRVLDASRIRTAPAELILPPEHEPILAEPVAGTTLERLPAIWIQGIEEADADAITREAALVRGLFIRPDKTACSLGNGSLRTLYLRRLPRILLEDRDLIADNTDVAVSMGKLFEDLIQTFANPEHTFPHIYLATGYLFHYGFIRVLRVLENPKVRELKLLFSGKTDHATIRDLTALISEQLRDGLEYTGNDELWNLFRDAAETGRLQVRVYTDAFLHAKLFLGWNDLDQHNKLVSSRAAIGSSNLSRPGLGASGNLELDVTLNDPEVNTKLYRWFNHRWEEASLPVPSLLEVIDSQRPLPRPSFDVPGLDQVWNAGIQRRLAQPHRHIALLAHLHGVRLDRLPDLSADPFPHNPDRDIHPTIEQEFGVLALVQRIQQSRLGFLADSVGLGKTITALGTAWYLVRMGAVTSVALVAPRKLFDQWRVDARKIGMPLSWLRFINRHKLERKDPEGAAQILNDADLIIAEEAHEALRTRQNKLWRNLRSFLQEHRTCRLLLVSATPWNNRREDIFNYLLLAWQSGRLLQEHYIGLDSEPLRGYLDNLFTIGSTISARAAANTFERMPLRQYRTLFDHAFVQRTRTSLARRYDSEINYPRRRVHPHFTQPTVAYDQLFADLAVTLDELYLPYRDPFYALFRAAMVVCPSDTDPDQPPESNLHRRSLIQLYKRAESSIFALAVSLQNIIHRLGAFQRELEALADSDDPRAALGQWLEAVYLKLSEEAEEAAEEDEVAAFQYMTPAEKARYKNLDALLARFTDCAPGGVASAIEHVITEQITPDIERVQALRDRIDLELDQRSPKARELARHARRAHDEGHKPILVASYADTALRFFLRLVTQIPDARIGLALGGDDAWLHDPENHDATSMLADEWTRALAASPVVRRQRLLGHANRARSMARSDLLDMFAPRARLTGSERLELLGGEIDILVGSEAISIGQNLQDSTCLIQLDLPWNPMVIEQRIGRIDRRGGGRPDPDDPDGPLIVDIHYCWSVAAIEQEVGLRARLEHKAGRAMEDTNFDELLLHELRDKLRQIQHDRAQLDAGEQARLGEFFDARQRELVDQQTRVADIPHTSGSELDGLRALAEWRRRNFAKIPEGAFAAQKTLACSMVPALSADPPLWLLTIEVTPLQPGDEPVPGSPLWHQLPVTRAMLAHPGQTSSAATSGTDLEVVVRALLHGGPALPRPGVYRREWTHELLELDRLLITWRDQLVRAHNAEHAARVQESLTPATQRTPSAHLRHLMVQARDALRAELRRVSQLGADSTPRRTVMDQGDKLRFLMNTALEPDKLATLLAEHDPADVEQVLVLIKTAPHRFLQEQFEEAFDRLCGALYHASERRAPEQLALDAPGTNAPGIDDRWAGARIRVVAATYCGYTPPLDR